MPRSEPRAVAFGPLPNGHRLVTAHGGRPFTVGSSKGDTRWRVIAVSRADAASLDESAGADRESVIVSTSLADVDSTVDRMWGIYEIAGLCLLGALAVAGWFAVRSGLRPLSRIEQTAAEIAAVTWPGACPN